MYQLCFICMAEDPIISSSSLFEALLFPALSSPFSKHSIVVCSSPSSVAISLVLSPLLPAGTKCGANKAVLPLLPQQTFHYFHYFPNAPSITSLNTHFTLVHPKPPISLSLPCTLFEVGNCWEPLMRRYATHLFLVPLSTICTSLLQGVRKIVPSRFLCAFKMHCH